MEVFMSPRTSALWGALPYQEHFLFVWPVLVSLRKAGGEENVC